jgi:hypothetical protein
MRAYLARISEQEADFRASVARAGTIEPASNKPESGTFIPWPWIHFDVDGSVRRSRDGQNKRLNICLSNDLKGPVSLTTSCTCFSETIP